MSRGPYDGKPYYCNRCGLGWGEFMACEEECDLESEQEAKLRKERHYAFPSTERENTPTCNHWPGQRRCGVCGMGAE